jgi:hypothetical protein
LSAVSRRTRPSTSFACASTTPKGRESSPYLNLPKRSTHMADNSDDPAMQNAD